MERHPRLVERVFTRDERAYCLSRPNPVRHFAARFAAKEAVGKALGTGVRCWQDIEISGGGRPTVVVSGSMAPEGSGLGAVGLSLSISHGEQVSVAVAVAEPARMPDTGR